MECNTLNHIEKVILNHLRYILPHFIELLSKQILSSEVIREKYDSHWFTFFTPSFKMENTCRNSSFSIQAVLGNINCTGGNEVRIESKQYVINPIKLISNGTHDIAFVIHIDNGILREFEFYNISGGSLPNDLPVLSLCAVYIPDSEIGHIVDN